VNHVLHVEDEGRPDGGGPRVMRPWCECGWLGVRSYADMAAQESREQFYMHLEEAAGDS
jgi:hypothetical protein